VGRVARQADCSERRRCRPADARIWRPRRAA